MKNYINQIYRLENPSFQNIKQIARECISHLTKEEDGELYNKLKRGVAILDSHESMCKYLYAYGNMHQAKLLKAYDYLPNELVNHPFEVIDWGCGQGMATMNLFDFLRAKRCEKNIRKITLIEPAKLPLERAVLHVEKYVSDNVKIKTINSYFENVIPNQIISDTELPQVHLFSNILDVEAIDLKILSHLIDDSIFNDSYLVCVGPMNPSNQRIDAFLKYFDENLIEKLYVFKSNNFKEGKMINLNTCKIIIYKLEPRQEGHLIPIEYYPPVQFQAAYELDVIGNFRKNEKFTFNDHLTHFEVAAPFDLGANVYDDVHPILAVANNIITRGLPTKASPFIEKKMQEAFNLTSESVKYGEFKYVAKKNVELNDLDQLFKEYLDNIEVYRSEDAMKLQMLLTPIAIARFQKMMVEALITGKLPLDKPSWNILIEEEDVPFGVLAVNDLKMLFDNLFALSEDYQHIKLPEIELTIISNKFFQNSPLHLGHKVYLNATNGIQKATYDLVVTQAVLKSVSKNIDAFSKFKSQNNCYFNLRTIVSHKTDRVIYTSDKIMYRPLVKKDTKGNYFEIDETKTILTYFLHLLFRKENFRPGQLPILDRALQNKAVIGLLPTGGGKSLTYQIAALLQPGVTLVVDPLKSLMKDQYDGLLNNGIDNAAYINSTMAPAERQQKEQQLETSQLLFCFLSPERLTIANFRERLANMHNSNIYFSYGVIDEVHCVSEWGHDFRFSYLHLGRNLYKYVKSKMGEISLFGLTATASFDVLADVERELSGNGAFDLDADVIVRYENTNRLELQYKIERVKVQYVDIYTAELNSKHKKDYKLKNIHYKFKELLKDGFSLPVKISSYGVFNEAKSESLKDYIQKIPDYFEELQSDNSIQKIKNAFQERQGIAVSTDIDLNIEIDKDFYKQKCDYKHAGIIFCPHKNGTRISVRHNKENLSSLVPCIGTYTGGDSDDSNDDTDNISMQNLELFRANKQPLMIATKAFGMGIDKPNVRFTINMNYSSSLEGFVQEAGRAGRDRKMALSIILLADYHLARINKRVKGGPSILQAIKGEWFETAELKRIIEYYNLNINEDAIDYLTPEYDYVRLFCGEGKDKIFFDFKKCKNTNCSKRNKCNLRNVPKEAENWKYKKDLDLILEEKNLKIEPKYIEYLNSDYNNVLYFFNNNYKGEYNEKKAMIHLLNQQDLTIALENEINEYSVSEQNNVNGFLTTLKNASIGQKIISYIDYGKYDPTKTDIDNSDIEKAIYRMTCIELIEDFTRDYKKKQYRIVATRKVEGAYYKGLNNFLIRYYSADRAEEEIKKVHLIKLNKDVDCEIIKEIYQCLSYLTTFVYDKISKKRKRAIDDMRKFCIEGLNGNGNWLATNEKLKDELYFYFNSKYAKDNYVTESGEPFSLVDDTDDGKISNWEILFKYLRVVDDDIVGVGTPLDNVKHLYGAVRLLSRSLTDSNPALSLLNAFCLAYMKTKNNVTLENQLHDNYIEGFLEAEKRSSNKKDFWNKFNEYNGLVSQYIEEKRMEEFREEVMLKVHSKHFKKITEKYLN